MKLLRSGGLVPMLLGGLLIRADLFALYYSRLLLAIDIGVSFLLKRRVALAVHIKCRSVGVIGSGHSEIRVPGKPVRLNQLRIAP